MRARTALALSLVALSACGFGADEGSIIAVPAEVQEPRLRPPENIDNPFQIGRTLVIPHGGGDGLYPDNTLFAYERSKALGGDVIDIDVQLAADGVLIAFHDFELDRTTNGAGPTNALTSIELAELDAGWGFERDGGYPFRGQGITIPTVEEVLLAFPNDLVTLDLKDRGPAPVQPVCDLLRRLDRTDVYVGTDTNDQVPLFREVCPELETSGTQAERQARRDALAAGQTSLDSSQLIGQPSYIGRNGEKRITEEYLAFMHASGTAILTWVVDDPDTLRELINLGIDGIYTRRPDVMVEIMRDMGEL